MEIRVTKKQNIVVDGVKYKAKEVGHGVCTGCAFDPGPMAETCRAVRDTDVCTSTYRADGRSVVWVKKEPKWIPVNGAKPADLPDATQIEWKNKLGTRGGPIYAGGLAWAKGLRNEVTHYRLAKAA